MADSSKHCSKFHMDILFTCDIEEIYNMKLLLDQDNFSLLYFPLYKKEYTVQKYRKYWGREDSERIQESNLLINLRSIYYSGKKE